METLKSARFWISLVVLAIIGGLAFVGKIGGDVALAALMGIGGGWGIAQAPAKTKTGLLALAFLASLSACGTWKDNATKTLSAVQTLTAQTFAVVKPHYDKKCLQAVREKGLASDDYVSCDAERHRVYSALKASNSAVRALGEVIPLVQNVMEASK